MSVITYMAQRELKSGHLAGQSFSIEFAAQVLDRSGKVIKNVSISLGGQSEAIRIRRDTFWQVKSDIIPEVSIADWREFLASTDANEAFTFDPFGTIAVPDAPVGVERMDEDDAEVRVAAARLYTIDFKVRVL